MRYGLPQDTLDKIGGVLKKIAEVDEAILYGSRAKGTYKPGSDIDIALKGERLTLQLLNTIGLELDELLLPYLFDIAIYHHIGNPALQEHIQRVGKVLYKKTPSPLTCPDRVQP